MVGARPRAGRARRPRRRPHRRLRRGARARRALARRGVRPPRRARARDREADRDRARGGGGPRRRTQDPERVLEADSAARGCSSRSATAPCASSARCASSSRRRRPHPSGRTGCASSRSTRSVTRSSSTPRTRRRSRMPGTSRRATSSRGRSGHLGSERFDPTLWCVVRAGDEIAAGTICTGDTYGGGLVHALFTRRPWRKQGVGAALLADAFGRFWDARRAQRRARRRRGERHRRLPPLRARRDGARARLGGVREGARRCCVSLRRSARVSTG